MFVLSDTHVFNSNLVNVARFGFMRFDGLASVVNPIQASDLGMSTPTGFAGVAPGISINGLFTTGDAGTPSQWQNTNSFIWQDTVSVTYSRHTMRYGFEVKRHEVDVDAPFSSSGLLQISTFDDFLLGQSAAQNGSPTGVSNVTDSGGSSGIFRKDERYTDVAGFIQDADIRLTERLSVNAGLRYEIFGPPVEIHGLLPSFDPGIAAGQVPATGSLSGYTLPGNFHRADRSGCDQDRDGRLVVDRLSRYLATIGLCPSLEGEADDLVARRWLRHLLRPSLGRFFRRAVGAAAIFAATALVQRAKRRRATLQSPFSPLLPPTSSFPIYQPRSWAEVHLPPACRRASSIRTRRSST